MNECSSFCSVNNEMEIMNTGASEVNIKEEICHPVETSKTDVGEHNNLTSLEFPSSDTLEEIAGISDTVINCKIENNEQSTSIFEDLEVNKGMRKHATTPTRQTIIKHNKKWYKCSSCNYKSKYKGRLKSHFRLKHDDNPVWYQCYFCSRKTKSKHNLLVHFQTQHDTDPMLYQCHHCGFETKYKHWLSEHIKTIHYKSTACFRCSFCKFRTFQENSLKKHIEQHQLIVCPKCDYRTPKNCLNHHIKVHHSKSPKWYQCQFCHFKSKYKQNMSAHVKRFHNQDSMCEEGIIEWFHCDLCKFKSTNLWYLEFHSKYSHSPTDDLDPCEVKTEETADLSLTSDKYDIKEECIDKSEFKIDPTSDTYNSDVYKEMIQHIEVKPDLELNLNDTDIQSDLHIDDCDFTIDLTSDSSEIDTQYGPTDHCDLKHNPLQNFSENIIACAESTNHSVVEIEQQPHVTLNYDENFIREKYNYPVFGEELKSFQCDLCEFTSFSQWCLDCHSKYTHNVNK